MTLLKVPTPTRDQSRENQLILNMVITINVSMANFNQVFIALDMILQRYPSFFNNTKHLYCFVTANGLLIKQADTDSVH